MQAAAFNKLKKELMDGVTQSTSHEPAPWKRSTGSLPHAKCGDQVFPQRGICQREPTKQHWLLRWLHVAWLRHSVWIQPEETEGQTFAHIVFVSVAVMWLLMSFSSFYTLLCVITTE